MSGKSVSVCTYAGPPYLSQVTCQLRSPISNSALCTQWRSLPPPFLILLFNVVLCRLLFCFVTTPLSLPSFDIVEVDTAILNHPTCTFTVHSCLPFWWLNYNTLYSDNTGFLEIPLNEIQMLTSWFNIFWLLIFVFVWEQNHLITKLYITSSLSVFLKL